MRKEEVFFGERAVVESIDARQGYADACQDELCDEREVTVKGLSLFVHNTRIVNFADEWFGNVWTNFERTRSNAWPNGGCDVAPVSERLRGGFDNSRHKAAPTRVNGHDGSGSRVREQDRHTIGGANGACDERGLDPNRVGLHVASAARCGPRDVFSVHLFDLGEVDSAVCGLF